VHRRIEPGMQNAATTPRRAELNAYIAQSRSVQRGLRWLLALGAGLTVAFLLGGAGTGVFWPVVAPTAIVTIVGFWITYGHIADFEKELAALDAAARRRASPEQGRDRALVSAG
jgi:fatty acid desaturase